VRSSAQLKSGLDSEMLLEKIPLIIIVKVVQMIVDYTE
jgi:hypothetical protein